MIAMGRRVYGLGAVALGVVELAFGGFASAWLPVPAHIRTYRLLALCAAAWLIAAGLAVQARRTAPVGALALAALFAAGMLVFLLPPALAKPRAWVAWQAMAESTAMALGGLLAYAGTLIVGAGRADAPFRRTVSRLTLPRLARWAFGACLLVFGVSHFVYDRLTASLVPAWLPPSRLAWAWVTGAAQIAAGLAMLSGVQARLAAILLAVMYTVFAVLVHIPSIAADPASHDAWAENAINLLLLGAAWTLADSLATATSRR